MVGSTPGVCWEQNAGRLSNFSSGVSVLPSCTLLSQGDAETSGGCQGRPGLLSRAGSGDFGSQYVTAG